jgi:predicted AlkP superfamily pyrophosphatase or phosphodiesterase
VRPLYADYAFGNIPCTIEFLLARSEHGALLPPDCFGGSYPEPSKVVLFLVDSFGWEFWQQYHRRFRTTARVADEGTLTPISALFPSTTAASVTTLNWGALPSAHALYEWNVYIPAYGETIQSLAFSPLGQRVTDACLSKGYDPAALVAVRETLHQRLARKGVRSIQFSHHAYAGSAFNRMATAGAEVVTHATLAQALVQLKAALQQTEGKALLGFYWAAIDSIAHLHGPGTPYHAAEIASFWHTFDEVLRDIDSPDTLYLFTADHGHVYADAADTINLNERLPQLADYLAVSPTGNRIYPNGSPRDVFLHIRPERRDETVDLLCAELGDAAMVTTMDAALREGLFGPQPVSEELRRRLGDILILPRLGHFVWWREPGIMANTFHGHHGGLTPNELITAFGAVDAL